MADAPTRFRLPAAAQARLHVREACGRPIYFIAIAVPPVEAKPEAVTTRGLAHALLSHDPGVAWPDSRGEALMHATVEAGGVAVLAFPSLADALKAKARLDGAR